MIKNMLWLFEAHKNNPITNTIILIMVMSVTSGKHSEQDAEPACFVICTTLETSQDALYSMEYLNTQHRLNVPSGFNCGYCMEDFRSVWSPHRRSVSVGCLPLGHTETAER